MLDIYDQIEHHTSVRTNPTSCRCSHGQYHSQTPSSSIPRSISIQHALQTMDILISERLLMSSAFACGAPSPLRSRVSGARRAIVHFDACASRAAELAAVQLRGDEGGSRVLATPAANRRAMLPEQTKARTLVLGLVFVGGFRFADLVFHLLLPLRLRRLLRLLVTAQPRCGWFRLPIRAWRVSWRCALPPCPLSRLCLLRLLVRERTEGPECPLEALVPVSYHGASSTSHSNHQCSDDRRSAYHDYAACSHHIPNHYGSN